MFQANSNGKTHMTEADALAVVIAAAKEATRKLRTKRNPSDEEMHQLFAQMQAIDVAVAIHGRFSASEKAEAK